jgi:hypothetical protein
MTDHFETSSNDLSSSELRFDALPDRGSAVDAIVVATSSFAQSSGVVACVPGKGDDVPDLNHVERFRYADQYVPFADALRQGEDVTVATVLQAGEVVAFGFAEVPSRDGVEIMTIDVATDARRSASEKSTIEISGESFEIGIGHVLVLALIESVDAESLMTNATTSPARYLFKSLGFLSTDEENSCLLRLEKS